MKQTSALLALAVLAALPAVARANWVPAVGPDPLPYALLGEIVPIILELLLLRHWLKLSLVKALPAVLTANAVSILVSLAVIGGSGYPIKAGLLLYLSDLLYLDWQDLTLTAWDSAREVGLWSFVGQQFKAMAVLTILTVVVELPVYRFMLQPHTERRAAWPSVFANLISYPAYYSLIIIGLLVSAYLQRVVR